MNYQISIKDFEGPFDLLLHLVKETKMDIYEINMSMIIEDYLTYIHSLQELNIDVASEFLIMASELIHLKSKMLIGKTLEEEKEDSEYSIASEEDLKKRIIEYQKYKEITKSLKEMEEKRGTIFTKVPESLKEYFEEPKLTNDGITVDDLVKAFLSLQERIHFKEPVTTKITRREISVESRRVRIQQVLKEKRRVSFEELFEVYTKEYVVVTFMALLDMTKNQEVVIGQEDNFAKIWIEKQLEVV
ncbi:MAG: segregation/condensation protein A [Bacilli bacterium]|nr:segregation/condensation protein A [Bacilli bacterium]